MQQVNFANSLMYTEAGFETPGLPLYKDANSAFNFELNNKFVNLLNKTQLETAFEVRIAAFCLHICFLFC
jgi:hypothetical protein